jgi:hypothetical protein
VAGDHQALRGLEAITFVIHIDSMCRWIV